MEVVKVTDHHTRVILTEEEGRRFSAFMDKLNARKRALKERIMDKLERDYHLLPDWMKK